MSFRLLWLAGSLLGAAAVPAAHRAAPSGPSTIDVAQPARPDTTRGIQVCSGGDVLLGNNLDPAWERQARSGLAARFKLDDHPDSLVAPLRPLVADADIVLLNIEGAIGDGAFSPKCSSTSTACYAFRQPPAAAGAIRRVAPRAAVIGTIANNHALDAGATGRLMTARLLREAGVAVTGADTLATPVAVRGDTVAFLGFHTSSLTPDARDLAAVRRHVARAAARWPTVVVTAHIGAEGVRAQRTSARTETFLGMDRGNPVAFATAAFEAGATLVVGHGPHVLRAAEWRGTRLVFYSLGNLLTYGTFSTAPPRHLSAIACARITAPGEVSSADLRPTVQAAAGVVRADSLGRALRLVDSLSALDFPRSGVRVAPAGQVLGRAATR